MEYSSEFETRNDVFKYDIDTIETRESRRFAAKVRLYFVPQENGKYAFCTQNKSISEKSVQCWMDRVKNKEVPLESIPYVIWDAKMKGTGGDVLCDYSEVEGKLKKFARSNKLSLNKKMLPSHQPKQRGTIQVIGLAVEKYIRSYDATELNEAGKDEAERYHLIVRDVKSKQKYAINLHTALGPCGTGYSMSSWGYLQIKRLDKGMPFSYKPIEPMFVGGFSIDPYTLAWKQEHNLSRERTDWGALDRIENNVFTCSFAGRDPYYPSGFVSMKMDKFEKLPRAIDKRPVWIIKGPSGTGKSTLAGHLEGLSVFETDSVDKLPETIYDDVVVLGNRSHFSVDDVKKRLFGDPQVIEISFDAGDREHTRDKGKTKGGPLNPGGKGR